MIPERAHECHAFENDASLSQNRKPRAGGGKEFVEGKSGKRRCRNVRDKGHARSEQPFEHKHRSRYQLSNELPAERNGALRAEI